MDSNQKLKMIHGYNWTFITRIKSNRTVSTNPVERTASESETLRSHRKG